jgi:hypothetical protein
MSDASDVIRAAQNLVDAADRSPLLTGVVEALRDVLHQYQNVELAPEIEWRDKCLAEQQSRIETLEALLREALGFVSHQDGCAWLDANLAAFEAEPTVVKPVVECDCGASEMQKKLAALEPKTP